MCIIWETFLNNFDAHQTQGLQPKLQMIIHSYIPSSEVPKKLSDFLLSGLVPSSSFLFFSPTS